MRDSSSLRDAGAGQWHAPLSSGPGSTRATPVAHERETEGAKPANHRYRFGPAAGWACILFIVVRAVKPYVCEEHFRFGTYVDAGASREVILEVVGVVVEGPEASGVPRRRPARAILRDDECTALVGKDLQDCHARERFA